MPKETDQPFLGSVDASLLRPEMVEALAAQETNVIEPSNQPRDKIAVTFNGRKLPDSVAQKIIDNGEKSG